MSQPYSVIGKRTPRKDAVELVTGAAQYAIDVNLPGMLYGRILRSPYAHAKITAIDTSKALALPGVEAVITYKDVPSVTLTMSQAPSATTGTYAPTDTHILESEVRYVGDEVAAVAATDPFIAEDALDLIQVTYQQLPFVLTPDAALASGAPPVHTELTSNLIAADSKTVNYGSGSADAALAAADNRFSIDVTTPLQPVAPLGPLCGVFDWPSGGGLTAYDGNQGTYITKAELAHYFGIPTNNVKVLDRHMGFGSGMGNAYRYHPIGALLAKMTGKPVKLDTGKAYTFAGAPKMRHPMEAHSTVGINNDGTLKALEVTSTWAKGAYTNGGFTGGVAGTEVSSVYALPGKYAYQTAYTNHSPCGAYRGYGDPQGCFMVETVVNSAAEQLGIDPVVVRSKSVITTGYNNFYAVGLGDCLSRGAAAFGWSWTPFKSKTNTGVKKTGIGCAVGAHTGAGVSASTTNSDSATVMMNTDGTATVISSVVEMGTGVVTNLAMIAAEELGMSLDHVGIEWGDSTFPEAGIQDATRTTHNVGRAVQAAADVVRQQLFGIAATMLNTTPDKLSYGNETIFLTSTPGTMVTYAQILLNANRSLIGTANRPNPTQSMPSDTWFANFAEVSVDTETGEVNLNRMLAAHDIGRVINLATCESQVHGGTIQSLGWSLSEEYVVDNQTGTLLTDSYLDYGLYSIGNTPPIAVLFVESNDPYGPFGAKGIGEPPCNAPAASIASAIYNAVGVWVNPPFTPGKVLQALGKV